MGLVDWRDCSSSSVPRCHLQPAGTCILSLGAGTSGSWSGQGGVSKRAHAHTQAWPEGDSISPVSTCLARCRPGPSRRSRAAPPGPQSCVWPMAFMRERILQHTAADSSVRWQRRQLSRCWHSGDMQAGQPASQRRPRHLFHFLWLGIICLLNKGLSY